MTSLSLSLFYFVHDFSVISCSWHLSLSINWLWFHLYINGGCDQEWISRDNDCDHDHCWSQYKPNVSVSSTFIVSLNILSHSVSFHSFTFRMRKFIFSAEMAPTAPFYSKSLNALFFFVALSLFSSSLDIIACDVKLQDCPFYFSD